MPTPINKINNITDVVFRQATQADLQTIIDIENAGFTPEEAATPEAMKSRIDIIPDSFIIAEYEGKVIGFVDGPVVAARHIYDELFTEVLPNPAQGGHQSILGLAVDPAFRNNGLGSLLLKEIIKISTAAQRETVTLTCRDFMLDFYTKLGFVNEGISESTHGGYVWYNMVYEINKSAQ